MLLWLLACTLCAAVAQHGVISLQGSSGLCFALLETDGFGNKCFSGDEVVTIEAGALADSQAYALLLYDRKGAIIRNLRVATDHLLSSSPAELTTGIDAAAVVDTAVDPPMSIRIVWPREGLHITASSLHVHYNTFGRNKTTGQHIVCSEIWIPQTDTAIEGYKEHTCTAAESRALPIHDLDEGRYCVRVHIVMCATAGDLCNEIAQSGIVRPSSLFTDSYSDARSSSVCFSVTPSVGTTFLSATSPTVLNPASTAIDGLPSAVHVLAISSRSVERYRECEVMIKSLLHSCHDDDDFSPLVLHLVVDGAGAEFFGSITRRYEEVFRRRRTVVVTHDYSTVCERPLESFLAGLNLPLSAHASGAAGYCRLFLHDYFMNTDHVTSPRDGLITIETDQIVLSDIRGLWALVQADALNISSRALFAAAENYQPWQDSRPFSTAEKLARLRERARLRGDVQTNLTAFVGKANHGYGIIGGIMGLNFKRMTDVDWKSYLCQQTQQYLQMYPGWVPQLNDQDVFNALAEGDSSIVHILPCEWNVQIHARINSIIYCAGEIIRGASTPNLMDYFSSRRLSVGDIPLNCDESARREIFVCERRASVLHYMGGSHTVEHGFMQYYSGFWKAFADLRWNLLM